MQTLTIKQGDRFGWTTATPVELPASWLAPTATCTVNNSRGVSVGTLTVELTDDGGTPKLWTVTLQGDTTLWPVGVLRSDVLFSDAGSPITHTSTFLIDVQRPETANAN